MKSEDAKAREIDKKRQLAAKGLKERQDGKPIDPMEDVSTLAIDKDANHPDSEEEKQNEIADRGLAVGLGLKR
jgi:hypothetical protein